jgi:hypothetical protein
VDQGPESEQQCPVGKTETETQRDNITNKTFPTLATRVDEACQARGVIPKSLEFIQGNVMMGVRAQEVVIYYILHITM